MRSNPTGVSIATSEVFTVVTIQVEVFWVVTLCSVVLRYHMETAWTSETLVPYHNANTA
jgi:hypothetical protein